MAKIDTAKIEGYADMTAEEKIAALEGFTFDDGAEELKRYKDAVTKANGEAADYKRQLKELQDKAAEGTTASEKQLATLTAQLKELQKEKTISDYTAKYAAQGYDAELAADTAKALADGDMEKVFANQKTFVEARDKAIKAELMKNTPKPDRGGTPSGKYTKEQFEKMSYAQKVELYEKSPEEYKALVGR